MLLGVVPTPAIAFRGDAGGRAGGDRLREPQPVARQRRQSDRCRRAQALRCDRSRDRGRAAGARRRVTRAASLAPRPFRRRSTTTTSRTCSACSRGATLEGRRVVVDCANGAAFALGAARVPRARCRGDGAARRTRRPQHQRRLRLDAPGSRCNPHVRAHGAHVGLALDGDADRVLAVDEHGELVDGDQIMTMLALDLQARDALRE